MLDRQGDKAIYIQLADTIRRQINDGKIKPGDKLPSESEMQKEYNVARLTVREALSVLVNEGLLEKMHGKGTFCKQNAKSASVDVLLNMNDYYFIPYYIQSISGVLDKYNINFVVGDTKNSTKETAKLLEKISKRGSDGVIVQVSPEAQYDKDEIAKAFDCLARAGIPFVQIDAAYDTKSYSYAIMDEEKIGELAANHLYECGHRKIAIVTLPDNRISDMRMKHARKVFDDVTEIVFDDMLTESIRSAYDGGATAIFCFNDQIAKECFDSIHSLALSTPDDISLVSVDDTIVSNLYGITSISHAKGEIGKIAAKAIVRSELPLKKTFEPVLAKRTSVKKID